MEYEIGALAYFFSGSLPVAGGAKSLERLLVFGVVKAPISLLATFSKWIAAASDRRLMEDSIFLICMACESRSLSTVQARLLIWYVTLARDWAAKALASSRALVESSAWR